MHDSRQLLVLDGYGPLVSFDKDLARVQADRLAAREQSADVRERFEERAQLVYVEAAGRLNAAAAALVRTGVQPKSARMAHKQRQRWQWPAGLSRVRGWLLNCGDALAMLREDGWLATAHLCSDPARTICACPFVRAAGPLPRWVGLAPESLNESQRADGLVPGELFVHTTVQGTRTFYAFNEWLTTQVADIIEGTEVSSPG